MPVLHTSDGGPLLDGTQWRCLFRTAEGYVVGVVVHSGQIDVIELAGSVAGSRSSRKPLLGSDLDGPEHATRGEGPVLVYPAK